jgi:hypothetical protein
MLAVNKAIGKKDGEWARDAVVPGTYPVDVTVRVSGDVRVGEDTDKASTSSLVSEDFLIVALHMAGCTRDRAAAVIEQVAAAWVGMADRDAAKRAREEMVERFDADGNLRALFAEMKARMPRTQVRGSVAFKGAVEVVSDAAARERVA